MRVVSLEDFTPGERFDGNPWMLARFEEAADAGGPWAVLETLDLAVGPGVDPVGLDPDPRDPSPRNFTTQLAQLAQAFYRIVFVDAAAHEQATAPVFDPAPAQAYTSVIAVRRVLSPDGSTDPKLGTAASLSENEIEEAIEEAATEINSRLAARYSLPFAEPVPPLVEALNRDIAAYLATLVHRRGKQIADSEPVALRYARAQALLDKAAKGQLELVSEPEAETTPQSASEVAVENPYEGDLFTLDDFALSQGPPTTREAPGPWPWDGP